MIILNYRKRNIFTSYLLSKFITYYLILPTLIYQLNVKCLPKSRFPKAVHSTNIRGQHPIGIPVTQREIFTPNSKTERVLCEYFSSKLTRNLLDNITYYSILQQQNCKSNFADSILLE